MADVKPIRTEKDYEAALARVDELMDAAPGSPEGDELDVLVDLVELYESKHEPMGYPSPLAALEFRMDQGGMSPRDLIPFIGSRAKVSEVLSGKRAITMPMARALHEHLGIPGRCASMAVMNLANVLQVHPAIIAGKVRYERQNHRLLSQFVGTGEVRRQFGMAA